MTIVRMKNILSLVVASMLFGVAALGQNPAPFLQDIQVHKEPSGSATPLVKKTGSAMPAGTSAFGAIKSSFPILADTQIPGHSGVLVETLDGNVVVHVQSRLEREDRDVLRCSQDFRAGLSISDQRLDRRKL
jgi:hypothetical protein